MPDGRDLICTFDGSFDGFLTVVYYVVKNRIRPVKLCEENGAQLQLGAEVVHIRTNCAEGDRVRRALCDKVGYDGFKRAYYAFLCPDEGAWTSYSYILYALKYGRKTGEYMSAPDILKAYKAANRVSREADRVKGFLRFSVMEGGVEYAPCSPDNDILPLLMMHFAERLRGIPFVIHDVKREKAGVCNKGTWQIVDAKGLTVPELEEGEKRYRELWKAFYKSITIKERKNPSLQTQMLPKKYRGNMTEFN